MNTPQSDGTDSAIDIFVLSRSETLVTLLTGNLEKKGCQVSVFTDRKILLEALRTGKPGLLICDTTTLDKEGFEVCRMIKADNDLWVIPVLLLTSISMLSDLFDVLDCNADNFLPFPFDPPFGLSVIEGMIGILVEQQTPDQIKNQFKIRHDDRIYSVAASRRKLLELLLSTFEIAVNTSSELLHVKTDFRTLSESAEFLENRLTEQTRLIDTIQANLHQKELKILTLTSEVESRQKLLAQKSRKTLIVTDDGTCQPLFLKRNGIETSSFSEISMLRQEISELLNELDTSEKNLDTVRDELEEEKIHCTSLECTLELLGQQKELAEKSLRSITDERTQLIAALEAEREQVASAELEIKAIMQAKTESEQELTLVINNLNEIKNQQSADPTRLKSELTEKSLHPVTDEHTQLIEALEAERERAASAELEIKAMMQAKTQSEQELTLVINNLNEIKNQQSADLTRLKSELEMEATRRISAEKQMGSLCMEKEQSESLLRSTANDLKDQLDNFRSQLETARTALRNEENTTQVLKENLAELVAKNERTEMRVKEDLESDKGTVIKLKRDLDEATAIQKTRERDIEALTIKNKAIAAELNLANQSRTQSDQQIRLLADKLKKVQTELNTERRLHQAGDKKIEVLMETIHLTEQDLRTTVEERNKLIDLLENERKERVTSDDRSHQKARKDREHIELELRVATEEPARPENNRGLTIKNREKTSEPVSNPQKSLIKQLNVLTNERKQTEHAIKDLTDEPDRAKNVIVEKVENHLRQDDSYINVSEEYQVRNLSNLMEETTEIQKEDIQDLTAKKTNIPEIVEAPHQAFDNSATPDIQKPTGSEKELFSSKPSSKNSELFPKAVTDIINTFSDDDLF